MIDERVRVLSGGGPALLAVMAMITKQSPEVTAFTFPLYQPEAGPAVVDEAISTATIYNHIRFTFSPQNSTKNPSKYN
jgi:hypothetical protein